MGNGLASLVFEKFWDLGATVRVVKRKSYKMRVLFLPLTSAGIVITVGIREKRIAMNPMNRGNTTRLVFQGSLIIFRSYSSFFIFDQFSLIIKIFLLLKHRQKKLKIIIMKKGEKMKKMMRVP